MTTVNYVISSLQLVDPQHGDDNYVGSYVEKVPIVPFKWLPNFLL